MLVFIDMDGVVADFDKHVVEVYGKPMESMTNKEKDRFWDAECVAFRFFANSPLIQEGASLVKSLCEASFPVSFLTSTGGQLQHIEIAKQKLDFLQRHGFGDLPVAFATGTASKATFASPSNVLVDDREKVVDAFRSNGGVAHLFQRDRWQSVFDAIASR
jgi:hypothetical protein